MLWHSHDHSFSKHQQHTRGAGQPQRPSCKWPAWQFTGTAVYTFQYFQKSLGDLQPEQMPKGAVVFGAAGVLPYAATSATTIYLAHQASLAQTAGKESTVDADTALALLHHVENLQLGYGALILSFIGALHWGFEFAGYNGYKGYPRYLLGLAPVAVAMPTVLLEGELGLATQFGAFVGAWLLDRSASLRGWSKFTPIRDLKRSKESDLQLDPPQPPDGTACIASGSPLPSVPR